MTLTIRTDCSDVNWNEIVESLASVGMSHFSAEVHQRAFEASYAVAFIYQKDQLLGFGRAISDGEYQAALYDIAVLASAQGKGVGKQVIKTLLAQLPVCNVILYATPGMEGFYKKLGFGLMKTGMARFITTEAMERFTD